HCLIGSDERLWAIDHGICFHTEYKLRTVIWEFSGEPIADAYMENIRTLHCQLTDPTHAMSQHLCTLLSTDECKALVRRINQLLRREVYPAPQPHRRNTPWPPRVTPCRLLHDDNEEVAVTQHTAGDLCVSASAYL
ncbi:MAG: hypothetical protein LRY51_18150, partial [Geovibrio sp.]|nr:hypothetical protein [Geovibrio sp.]